jgi:hypothetical protein
MWRCFIGWAVPDVSKEPTDFVSNVQRAQEEDDADDDTTRIPNFLIATFL